MEWIERPIRRCAAGFSRRVSLAYASIHYIYRCADLVLPLCQPAFYALKGFLNVQPSFQREQP